MKVLLLVIELQMHEFPERGRPVPVAVHHQMPIDARYNIFLQNVHRVHLLILAKWERLQRVQVVVKLSQYAPVVTSYERTRSVTVVGFLQGLALHETAQVLVDDLALSRWKSINF